MPRLERITVVANAEQRVEQAQGAQETLLRAESSLNDAEAAAEGDLGQCAALVGQIIEEYARIEDAIGRERDRLRQAV